MMRVRSSAEPTPLDRTMGLMSAEPSTSEPAAVHLHLKGTAFALARRSGPLALLVRAAQKIGSGRLRCSHPPR